MPEQLDFGQVISLLNHSRFSRIADEPVSREEGWALYRGEYHVHAGKYDFYVVYLFSKASLDQVEKAARAVSGRETVHVVFPASLADYVEKKKMSFPGTVAGFWTVREYLASYIREELGAYSSRLSEAPKDYIDPPFDTPSGIKRKVPPPPLDFIATQPTPGEVARGTLGVILADAGQGKTYHCSYLVDRLRKMPGGVVPIFIDSRQWDSIPLDDLRSLSKTILHSFRYYGAPIPWIEGCEEDFLRVTLRAGLFRIIFDGFDEYVLRNVGTMDPVGVLEALSELAQETEARILLTSRSSFWHANIDPAELESLLQRTGNHIFTLLPFDTNHARNYFLRRLTDGKSVDRATQIFGTLRNQNPSLMGRGFVLRLIADLVGRGGEAQELPRQQSNQMRWLLERLCEREVERQDLILSAPKQLRMLTQFAREQASGEAGTSLLLEVCLQDVEPSLDDIARRTTVEKLKSHPLLAYEPTSDLWAFSAGQVGIVLLADALVDADRDKLTALARTLAVSPGDLEDLATSVCDSIARGREGRGEQVRTVQLLVAGLAASRPTATTGKELSTAFDLRASIALRMVELLAAPQASREERTGVLMELISAKRIEGFRFGGTMNRFDLRGIAFVDCAFQGTAWVACQFDGSTQFSNCSFSGAISAPRSEALAEAKFDRDCRLDQESRRWLENTLVAAGKRRYNREDLKADIEAIIRKFLSRGGLSVKTIRRSFLMKGSIADSPHRNEIVETLLKTVLETHHVSGVSDGGVGVRDEALDCVKFYAANNVFTGQLADASERLTRHLKLR